MNTEPIFQKTQTYSHPHRTTVFPAARTRAVVSPNPAQAEPRRLLCVLAHPDDESLAIGGTLAKYAAEGMETFLLMGTRGEKGWLQDPARYPGPEELGRLRAAELRAAARILGLRELNVLGYVDGEVDQADPEQMIARIVFHLRRLRPEVVVTFDPNGMYGHPDHIALSQFTAAAVICAADPCYGPAGLAPHRVNKLYYRVHTREELEAYQSVFGDLHMSIDGVERSGAGWQDWAITTRVHTAPYWRTTWQAIACHRTQVPIQAATHQLFKRHQKNALGYEGYYRVFSTVNGGRSREADLFEGLP